MKVYGTRFEFLETILVTLDIYLNSSSWVTFQKTKKA